MFDVIEDAVRFSRRGYRHWLTAFPTDKFTIPAKDSSRGIWIEARSAVVFDLFARRPCKQRVAREIAKRLTETGFETKRGSPSGDTIYGWWKQINSLKAKSAKEINDASQTHQARLHFFEDDWKGLSEKSDGEALDLLESDCRFFLPRLIGARPPEKKP